MPVHQENEPRIGLLGGSFDPIHLAHLALARAALRELHLAQVQFIPAANPWQRAPLNAAPEHRLRMIELAIDGESGMAVNPSEIERGGATYTVDTIRALPAGARYVWILGADQLTNFCTWHQWQEISARVDLAVATRPGTPLIPPEELTEWLASQRRQDGSTHRELTTLPFTPMAISASDIRARLARGDTTEGLLTEPVARYIAAHGLYR
ncbi:nicotinate (nicotinamide) nucleotide adenylyltransferase [Bordetella genomosp. 4]|uniref:Probable nicotinate-nucleotide adenylyltransferase n=1 Tax=Bordetella genomosp. 4 TaxID=463044 RepID=A0A261U5Q1_9BORD|nr:nicotinate (nicotinamide) nucleotide adenylyltransferase [Bordetella genomosp. 4]OZI56891.1 nicotinate (nicotinamide) nucleotide adenylyltransferase [Bordetella genomosp. 4]